MREYRILTQAVDETADVALLEAKMNALAFEGWMLHAGGVRYDYQGQDEFALFYATMERERPAEDPV